MSGQINFFVGRRSRSNEAGAIAHLRAAPTPARPIWIVMTQKFKPVFVWISTGTKQSVVDVVKAAQLLLNHWPQQFAQTDLHRAAQVACLAAWEADGDPELARDAFVAAAEEAGILAPADIRPTRRAAQPR